LVHLSSDVVRKQLAGRSLHSHQREAFANGLYAPEMTARTYAALRRRAAHRLRAGQGVVLDATYGNPRERAALQRLAQRLGVPLVALVCRADEAVVKRRLAAREGDRSAVSDARLDLWPSLRVAFVEPTEWPDAVSIDTTAPLEACVALAISAVNTVAPSGTAASALSMHHEWNGSSLNELTR
jgi:hypothetical protein